jgi:hypothetical protein
MKKSYCSFLIVTIAFITLIVSVIACNNNVIDNPITPLKAGETDATVSGFGLFYATDTHVIDAGTTFNVKARVRTANGLNDTLVIDLIISKQGLTPYTIDFSSDSVSSMNYCVSTSAGTCTNYHVQKDVGSGTLTVKSITSSDNVQGTFSGTFQEFPTGSKQVTITGGEFYATF